jgi:hypothetical protein
MTFQVRRLGFSCASAVHDLQLIFLASPDKMKGLSGREVKKVHVIAVIANYINASKVKGKLPELPLYATKYDPSLFCSQCLLTPSVISTRLYSLLSGCFHFCAGFGSIRALLRRVLAHHRSLATWERKRKQCAMLT